MIDDNSLKPANAKQAGLELNAYLNAERLYRETGDVRYLVIALGRPTGSHGVSEIPSWILEACEAYAASISAIPHHERKKIKHSYLLQPADRVSLRYQVFRAAVFDFAQRPRKPLEETKPLSFHELLSDHHKKRFGLKITSTDKQYYDRLRKRFATWDFIFEDDGTVTKLEGSLILEEEIIRRMGPRRS